jgi:Citrate transporter
VNVRYWHKADNPTAPAFVRYWSDRGQSNRGCTCRCAELSSCPLMTQSGHYIVDRCPLLTGLACILSWALRQGLMGGMSWMPDTTIVAAWLIFLATYVVVALGKIPVYRIDRAGAALLGGSLMVATGVLSLEEAYRAVDFNTIVLLLGMMIVVANLRLSGFFRVITHWIAGRPIMLLGMVIISCGVLSAFLVNDTVCLVMTPLVLELVTKLKRNPIPYLLATATASNIGSVATITGNPVLSENSIRRRFA